MLWFLKYAPRNLSEVAGNESAREEVKKWALDWDRGKPGKPLLIHGPTGVGKTALVIALANEFNWSLIETNASDVRSQENIKKFYGIASGSSGLFGEKRIVFIDELDSAFDRGEVPEILKIVKEARQPIILVANDVFEQKLSGIKAFCKLVEMKKINSRTIEKVLQSIAEKEGVSSSGIDVIARNSGGDLRSAITDLQAFAGDFIEQDFIKRDREESIFNSLRIVFKTTSFNEAIDSLNGVQEDLDTFIKWIEENIPLEYEKNEEIAESFQWVSKADVFNGRIRRRQNYSLLKYVIALSLAGVALSKKQAYPKFTAYKYPEVIKKLGTIKKEREILKSACLKIGRKLFVSSKEARNSVLPFIGGIYGASSFFEFSEEEKNLINDILKNKGV